MNLVRLMQGALAPYRRQVGVVVLLTALQTAVGLYLPNLTANIINNGIAKGDVGYIWSTGAVMLGLTLVQGTVAVIAVYFASRVSMGVGRDLRDAIFSRVMAFSA
ncbi:MAG: ABC transporter transmembrane domain-containing protein, partial [Candidatus Dormibacteria bacterium]